MTLTKCPNCGHTVLSVASQCPACSGSLTSTFLGLEHQGELAECRSCGRPVRSRTAVCPHCGLPSPARHGPSPRVVLPVIAAALLGMMAIALRGRAFQTATADSTVAAVAPPAPQTVTTPAVEAAPTKHQAESARGNAPAAHPAHPAPPAPARAVDSIAPAPASAGAAAALVDMASVMDSAALVAAGLQRRWTVDWSNMHNAPRNEAPVVRVLPPGTEVHVAEDKWGWFAILWKGDTVGYVAGALLRSTRPYRAP